MSSPTIKFIKSASVSITNGSKILSITGSVDAYHVYSGTAIFINNHPPVEGFSGTTIDGSGNSTITLKDAWTLPSVTAGTMAAFNSNEGLPEAIRKAREIGDLTLSLMGNFEELLNSTSPSISIDINGVPTNFTPYQYLADRFDDSQAEIDAQISTLVGSVNAMTKAEFFALAEQNKFASGFSYFGDKGVTNIQDYINSGGLITQAKQYLSPVISGNNSNLIAISGEAISKIGGALLTIHDGLKTYSNSNYGLSSRFDTVGNLGQLIKLPPAPDGTKTYDSASGAVVQHASTAIAFAAETATNKVITSRQDLVMIRSTELDVATDGAYPIGNMQYSATTANGFATEVASADTTLNRFGAWDALTVGNKWNDLQGKAAVIQNHENNIYSDDGSLKQLAYKVEVHEGDMNYANGEEAILGAGYIKHPTELGLYTITDGGRDWLCIPIAIVQRRNQGAYHPTYNPEGTARVQNEGVGSYDWYSNLAHEFTSTAECFELTNFNLATGYIASGLNGRTDSKFYDAIYATDVKDLRMSSEKKAANEISEIYSRKVMDDGVRGYDGAPHYNVAINMVESNGVTTYVSRSQNNNHYSLANNGGFIVINGAAYGVRPHSNDFWVQVEKYIDGVATKGDYAAEITNGIYPYIPSNGNNLRDVESAVMIVYGAYSAGYKGTYKQSNPEWVEVSGQPGDIAAAFPDGIAGQWNPSSVTGGVGNLVGIRKISDISPAGVTRISSSDLGVSWAKNQGGQIASDNTYYYAGGVQLTMYETQANFTESDALGVALHKSTSVMAINNHSDAILVSSLTGIVPTGVDNNEELSITKSVNGVISHTAESMVADVLFATQIESENGVAKFAFNIDDSGVIDSTNAQSFNTQYFISEE